MPRQTAKRTAPEPKARKPAVLPRSDGPAGVKAWIASLEPWQRALARRIDALVARNVPGVRRAMRWRCPFYGVPEQGWFLALAAFQRHLKLSFFAGRALRPPPPIGKFEGVRSLDVRQDDVLDEARLADWIRQAAAMPGWDGGGKRYGGVEL